MNRWSGATGSAVVVTILIAASGPGMLQITKPAGLNFVHRNSPTSQKYLIETMGGGVALLDYNNDGLLDIFFVNSGRLGDPVKPPAQFSRSDPAYWNRLYRQNRDGSFTDVTAQAGLGLAGDTNYGMGVATGDYDNDGFTDLYVTSYGRNVLYRNNGDGTFRDVTARAGVAAGGWSASAGFFDYDNDGKLDLFVTRYLDWNIGHNILCGERFHLYCRPDKFGGIASILYHNNGDGTFRDVSRESGIGAVPGKSLGLAFNDYDNDGFPDVYVANDGMEQFLWHNNGNGTFTNRAIEAGVALSDDGKAYSGMGVDFADYDNDGLPDIVVTNLATEVYALYRNEGQGVFRYVSLPVGLAALSTRSSGWGVGWRDFDHDGWKDLFVAQSHVMDNIQRIDPELRYREAPLLARNVAGKLERVELPGVEAVAGRGAAFGDLDGNGFEDVVMTVLGDRPVVLRNPGNGNHWLTIRLVGSRSNRDGFGTKVTVNGQSGYATSAGSYLSASDKRLHFGLGPRREARVELRWPSGRRQVLERVAADHVLTVQEP
jgi:enediyne biosynthesis protein E4